MNPEQLDYYAITSEADNYAEILEAGDKIIRYFFCAWCPETFTSRKDFINHGVVNHVTLNSFFCTICDKGFKIQTELKIHAKTHIGERVYCPVCKHGYTARSSLNLHLAKNPPDKDFRCGHCDAIYHTDIEFKIHTEKEHNAGYRCFSCKLIFDDKAALLKHVATHNGDASTEFQCVICGKLHESKRQLREHIPLRHLGMGQRVCNICGKTLCSSVSLREHLRVHSGERPEACQFCSKTFSSKKILVIHLQTHTGERRHQCEHCDKTFTQRNSLVIHMRTHTGERPYDCTICGEKFISLQSMKLHKKKHMNAAILPVPI